MKICALVVIIAVTSVRRRFKMLQPLKVIPTEHSLNALIAKMQLSGIKYLENEPKARDPLTVPPSILL